MKSRFYLLASLLLISCSISVGFAAKTEHAHSYKSAFDNNGKPADNDKKVKDYSFNEDVEQLSGKEDEKEINEVPIPAALWLFGSAFFGLAGLIRKKT